MRAAFEVADVLHKHWPGVLCAVGPAKINTWQLRTLGAIKNCRTSVLGGHVDACTSCGVVRISYNSCRNRHCPKCQGREREQWIQKRQEELLAVPYFHIVFTLPDTLHPMALCKPAQVYNSLFKAAWGTIKVFGADPRYLGATAGMISILHTWGQTMSLHPHLHCIVPGGGLTPPSPVGEGKGVRTWKTAKHKDKYLFPVKAMSVVFRAKYLAALRESIPDIDKKILNTLYKKNWVIYAKRPFGNASNVVEYLGRYTHKIAISNHRIKSIGADTVTFSYKDYRKAGTTHEMTLEAMEFIRRFAMHILPKGFVRIRHYGILSSTSKKEAISTIRAQTPAQGIIVPKSKAEVYNPKLCPHCKTETMVTLEILTKRGPPTLKNSNKEEL